MIPSQADSFLRNSDLRARLRQEERMLILRDLAALLDLAANECALLRRAARMVKERDVARVVMEQLGEITPLLIEIGQLLPTPASNASQSRNPRAN